MKPCLLLLLMFFTSCAPRPEGSVTPPPDTAVTSPPTGDMSPGEPSANPFSPKPGDEKLTRTEIMISELDLLIRESYPPQIALSIRGDLPTPCHQLRAEIAPADMENRIRVAVYSVADPNLACIQVLEPFQEFIDLGTFPQGHYSVWVNGELAGEFDS